MYNIQEQCIISFILHNDWKQLKISKNLLGPLESSFFFICHFNALYVASLPLTCAMEDVSPLCAYNPSLSFTF